MQPFNSDNDNNYNNNKNNNGNNNNKLDVFSPSWLFFNNPELICLVSLQNANFTGLIDKKLYCVYILYM